MGIIADKLKLLPGSKNWLVAVQIPKMHIGCILYIRTFQNISHFSVDYILNNDDI